MEACPAFIRMPKVGGVVNHGIDQAGFFDLRSRHVRAARGKSLRKLEGPSAAVQMHQNSQRPVGMTEDSVERKELFDRRRLDEAVHHRVLRLFHRFGRVP